MAGLTNRTAVPYREHIIGNGRRPGNVVRVVIHDVNDLVARYDQVKIYRGSAEGGPFVEITGVGTRPVLVEDVTEYPFEDLTGTANSWYCITYFDSTLVVAETAKSRALPGVQSLALQIISVGTVRDILLAGIRQTLPGGAALPTAFYEFHIRNAVANISARTNLPLLPIQKTDVQAERVDYFRRDFESYCMIKMLDYPIMAVHSVSLRLPGIPEAVVIDFDPTWMEVYSRLGKIKIIPGVGAASMPLIGGGPGWVLFANGSPDFVPQMLRVSYTAGFPEFPELDPLIVETVGKRAAMDLLVQLGELLYPPGTLGNKIDVDGVSTSSKLHASPFGTRLAQYRSDVDTNCSILRSKYKGLQMTVA